MMPTNQLPQEILIKIFLYLPLVSIQACKLVSKQWNNLITDDPRLEHPSFAPFIFQNSLYCVSTKTTNPVKLSSRCNPLLSLNRIPIEWKHDDEKIFTHLLLLESSKGIACVVTSHRRLLFYNLFTGASYPPTELPGDGGTFLYGFGYDRYADDCKMMSVEKGNSLFWVYSLRNRAWKSFEGFPHATYYPMEWGQSRSCSFNGVLHWLVAKRHQNGFEKRVILTYDLHTCRFGEMLLPYSYGHRPNIVELGGRLCYCSHFHYMDPFLMVSTMREYGVNKSWTRFLSIDLTKLGHSRYRDNMDMDMDMIEPSGFLYKSQSGKNLLLFCKRYGTLYWYDIDNDKVTSIPKNTWEKGMDRKRKRQELEGMQQHIWLDR